MIIKSNIREAARSLYSAKQRTILALIGIVIGIGSVIAMVSIGTIVSAEVLRQFKEMGTDILNIRKSYSSEKGGRGGQSASIQLSDALNIPAFCPAVLSVAPFMSQGADMSFGGKKIDGSLLGVTQSFIDLNKLTMKKGRFISDVDEYGHFCVIGSGIYQKMLTAGGTDVIGEKIRVSDRLFTVAGILERVAHSSMRQFEVNDSVYVHITTASRIKGSMDISSIIAQIKPDAGVTAAQEQIKEYFAGKTKTHNITVTSAEQLIESMQKQMRLFTLLLGTIGSISLIVGGVGIMNVMLVTVSERRKEIGIRRALGARRGDIKSQFLIESVLLSLAGGFFGILLGIGASYIVSVFAKWQFAVSFPAIILGVGVSSAVGIFFGFYPARQASNLDPIVALRSE